MKKISINKKILAFLISCNIVITGCSISDKMKSEKTENSNDLSYTQSSIDENNNTYQSSYENSSNNESSIDKQESIKSKEESIEIVESITEVESDIKNEESSIEESSKDEISEEVSIVENSSEVTDNLDEEVSVDETSEGESSLEDSSEESIKDEISEEVSIEYESLEEVNEKSEETSEENDEIQNSKNEDSHVEESHEDEYDGSNDVYTDDDIYLRVKDYVNLRTEPNSNSKLVALMYKGDILKKLGYANNYYIVEYNGKKVYIAEEYVEEIKEHEQDNQESTIINEQNETNTNLSIIDICYFPNGSTLYSDKELTNKIKDIPSLESGEIYYKNDNVYYIESDGDRGYVSSYSASIISQPVVVVDESDQKTILFKNNEKKLEFPVVTGDINTPTTKGLSEIYYVSYDAILAGSTWEVGVGVFMPFTIFGEGFHDAWWRSDSEFGGNTYQGNGSHGCVNMMYYDAMTLAHEVEDSMYNENKKCKVLVKR